MNIRLIPILLVVLTIASCTSATLLPPPTATPAPPTPTATSAPLTPPATPASPITYEDLTVGFIQSGTAGKWFAVNTTSFETQPEIIPGIQLGEAPSKRLHPTAYRLVFQRLCAGECTCRWSESCCLGGG